MYIIEKIKKMLNSTKLSVGTIEEPIDFIKKPKTLITIKDIIEEGECFDFNLGNGCPLNVVTIADCHGSLMQKELKERVLQVPHLVFLLGDNTYSDIETIFDFFTNEFSEKEILFMGITGNHDEKNLLKQFNNIINLHSNIACYKEFRIGGFGGSIKYKPDNYYTMFTNEESKSLLSELPYCDILVTHDKPCFSIPNRITSHSGLIGIGDYIKNNKPKIVLHGHLHDRYVQQYENTFIRCCYRVESFQIS